VKSDTTAAQAAWSVLQAAVQEDGGNVGANYSRKDVDGAVASANGQVGTSNKARSDAQGNAKSYDQKATSKNSDAQKPFNGMNC
jgi:hypothetical protein